MRIVVPFVELHPATYAAVRALDGHDPEFVYVGDDDLDYGRLLQRVWADGATFMVVEQDIVATPAQVDELAACDCRYGCFPYPWTTNVGPALGCTKFAAALLAEIPDAIDAAMAIPSHWGKPGHWHSLDVALMRTVLRDRHGLQPHVHLPPAIHLNPKQQLLPQYADRPPDMGVFGMAL